MLPEEKIRTRMKTLRKRVAELSSKKMTEKLDIGDKYLLVDLLDDLIDRVTYLHHLEKSTCSQVLEACGVEYGSRRSSH